MLIFGKVIKGAGYGRKLGFPTANLDRRQYVRRRMKIRLGVYAGWASCKARSSFGKVYKAAIVIGPLDRRGLPKIEAHLIGFRGNLYGRQVCLLLAGYLRPFWKFKSESLLKKQIARDVKKAAVLSLKQGARFLAAAGRH